MKYQAVFDFEAGEKTCAISCGKFCEYCSISVNGGGKCLLFGGKVYDVDGWVMRSEQCLKSPHNPETSTIEP